MYIYIYIYTQHMYIYIYIHIHVLASCLSMGSTPSGSCLEGAKPLSARATTLEMSTRRMSACELLRQCSKAQSGRNGPSPWET